MKMSSKSKMKTGRFPTTGSGFGKAWRVYATLEDGLPLSDAVVLEAAIQAVSQSLTASATFYPAENGVYVPVGSVQFMLNKQVAGALRVEDYPVGSAYRPAGEYADCIFVPKEKTQEQYVNPHIVNYTPYYYGNRRAGSVRTLTIDDGVSGEFMRSYDLVSILLNNRRYFRLNKITEEYPTCTPKLRTTVIDDYRDWEISGLSRADLRYHYIRAFVTGDTEVLEFLTNSRSRFYDPYKTIVLGDYQIELLETVKDGPNRWDGDNIVLSFTVESADSPLLDLAPGPHRYYIFEPLGFQWMEIRGDTICNRGDEYPTASLFSVLGGKVARP